MPDTTMLDSLLAAYPGYDKLSEYVKVEALTRAVTPDSTGLSPGADGWQPTYDYAYAAILLIPALQAQPQATTVTSEGTSVSASTPDWKALRAFLASLSPICRQQAQGVFTVWHVPQENTRPTVDDSRLGVDGDVE